jgi:hypothetical protein
MADIGPKTLQWSVQFKVAPSSSTPNLKGDKITLPQSALEQLLSAATFIVPTDVPAEELLSDFNTSNPYSYTGHQYRGQSYERQRHLPHPLTFRIVNPANGNIVYAGIREFSAKEGEIGLSDFLRKSLDIKDQAHITDKHKENDLRLTVHAQQLPKGTYVRFRPLEAGYDAEDWKALLERYMRDTFTTLKTGEVLTIPSGIEEYRFLIDKVIPEGSGICIVDTDLEVDIEALSEEQARETLKRKLEKSQRAPGILRGSSPGGDVSIGGQIVGNVVPGHYVDYTLKAWDHSTGLEFELQSDDPEGALDLVISPLTARQRAKPRLDGYVFGDLSERPAKWIRLDTNNAELKNAEAIWVSVHCYSPLDIAVEAQSTIIPAPVPYSLRVSAITSSTADGLSQGTSTGANETTGNDEILCKNCQQLVPRRTLFLHENFCYRNNVLCPKCKEVFKRSSIEWNKHWHCEHDDAYGNSPSSHEKHNDIFHTQRKCSGCGFETKDLPSLAHHRTTLCPDKLILCIFCHLLVPQQGPEDLSPSDPEIIFSGLTPHELSDGARTTDCHMCGKIVRLRDMSIHLKHHDMERLSRITPRICRNINCSRTLDGVGSRGEINRPADRGNDIGLCVACFGPLYNPGYDPDSRQLKRRVERRYLTQLLTGCGRDWCMNAYCKVGRQHRDMPPITSKEASGVVRPILEQLTGTGCELHFCTDEQSQTRRTLADILTNEGAYDLQWCIAALEAEGGDLSKAETWLGNWAPRRAETHR